MANSSPTIICMLLFFFLISSSSSTIFNTSNISPFPTTSSSSHHENHSDDRRQTTSDSIESEILKKLLSIPFRKLESPVANLRKNEFIGIESPRSMYKAKKGNAENEFKHNKEKIPTRIPLFPRSFGAYTPSLSFGRNPNKQSVPFIMTTGSSVMWFPCTSKYVCTDQTYNSHQFRRSIRRNRLPQGPFIAISLRLRNALGFMARTLIADSARFARFINLCLFHGQQKVT